MKSATIPNSEVIIQMELKEYLSIILPMTAAQIELVPKPKVRYRPRRISLWWGWAVSTRCVCKSDDMEYIEKPIMKRWSTRISVKDE